VSIALFVQALHDGGHFLLQQKQVAMRHSPVASRF
jgi:hypothetical protein